MPGGNGSIRQIANECLRWAARVIAMGVFLGVFLGTTSGSAHSRPVITDQGHFVYIDADCKADGRRVVAALATIQRDVERRLMSPFAGGPAHVYVVGSHDRMQAVVGAGVPAWAGGVCVGSRSLVVIRSDRAHDGAPFRTLHTLLRHEWVHLAWHRMAARVLGPRASGALPRWFEEGLCESIGGGLSADGGARLELSAAASNLIPFEEIALTWPRDEPSAALAYAQGKSFVEYMASDMGWHKVADVLRHVSRDSDAGGATERLDRAIHRVTGQRLGDWESRWQQHAKETARPWFHLFFKDLTQTIFLLLAILSAIWFFVLRVRRRRAYEELVWEEAEQEAARHAQDRFLPPPDLPEGKGS